MKALILSVSSLILSVGIAATAETNESVTVPMCPRGDYLYAIDADEMTASTYETLIKFTNQPAVKLESVRHSSDGDLLMAFRWFQEQDATNLESLEELIAIPSAILECNEAL